MPIRANMINKRSVATVVAVCSFCSVFTVDNLSLIHNSKQQALFLKIPDEDTTYNFVVGMLYTQLFQTLYRVARFYDNVLPVPVDVYKRQIKKRYLIGISSVILFFCIVIGVCAYFYTENKKLELQQQQEKQIEKEKQKNDRLYLTYIGIENIPFLADETKFVQEYEKYIKEELKLPKVSISIFFSNYEQLSKNVYLLYSQINDTNSTVLQTVVNVSHHE